MSANTLMPLTYGRWAVLQLNPIRTLRDIAPSEPGFASGNTFYDMTGRPIAYLTVE